MKIVKSFSDPEFFQKQYHSDIEGEWFWGLGDDGGLYCKCPADFEDPDRWYSYEHECHPRSFSIRDMKRIVKAFGHLVVFT